MSDDSSNVPIRVLRNTNNVQDVRDAFLSQYNKSPDFYVRVPGRVNLIGEHIDYCGYSVCPMALEQDIIMAVSVEMDKQLRLHNLHPKFGDFQCDITNFEIKVGEGSPNWYQYFLCGVKGILDILPKDNKEAAVKGMQVVVRGRVPQSAGLSSSSALVSAAALATAHANNFSISKKKIANVCADCERHIGTQGGGMDQAIAFLAKEGCAKHIEFNPLKSSDVALPHGSVFVIAHSLTNLNKAATGDFNCRVIECRLAAQIMAKERGLHWPHIKSLGQLQKELQLDLPAMIALTQETLSQPHYSKQEVAEKLQTTTDELDAVTLLTSNTSTTSHLESFKLHQRAMHVFHEAQRVQDFLKICQDTTNQQHDISTALKTLGQLMSASHSSLRHLYECSHPQLDRLVEIAQKHSLGARLTGAGWGGCAVALLTEEMLPMFLDKVKKEFYKPLGVQDYEGFLFSTSPKEGASIFVVE